MSGELESMSGLRSAVMIESRLCKTSCSHHRCTKLFSFVSTDCRHGGDALWIARPNTNDQSCVRRAEYGRGKCGGWEDIPCVLDSE